MSKLSYPSVKLDVDTGVAPHPVRAASEIPFRILILGDFSGRANRGEPAPSRLRPYLIDRDNLDQVLARLRPELVLGRYVFRFRELDDFDPGRIYEQEGPFDDLRETRRMLNDPATFDEAAAIVRSWSGSAAAAPAPQPPAPTPYVKPSGGSLLDDILEDAAPSPPPPPDELQSFAARAAAAHLAPRQDPQLPELTTQVDEAASRLMRAILHHADFQALEAGWRAVDWLVRGLETGPELKLYLLDISKAELPGALHELHRLLVEQAVAIPGAEPWTLVVGNYVFARHEADIQLLGELAQIMRAAGAPFLAEADPSDAASPDAARLWDALRRSPVAGWIGLLLPRFLLRLPYGRDTRPVESFPFEEMAGAPDHRRYLWGNPALACAYLLGLAFNNDGWDMRPQQEIRGLPLHVYEEDGDRQLKPCAEMLMTEHDAESILEQGFMPLASLKDQDAVRLVRFQSIADPPTRLAGRWT